MRYTRLVPGLLILTALALPAAAQTTTDHERVRHLLELMRAGEMGRQLIENMVSSMKTTVPGLSDEYWEEFLSDVHPGELVDLLVPIYARHLPAEDVEELIRFYESPTGRRFLDRQPAIMEESMAVGEQWGAQIAERVISRMRKSTKKP